MGNKNGAERRRRIVKDDDGVENSSSFVTTTNAKERVTTTMPIHIRRRRTPTSENPVLMNSLSDAYNAPKNVSARASVVRTATHEFAAPSSHEFPAPPSKMPEEQDNTKRRRSLVRSLRCDRTLVNMTPIDRIGIDTQKRKDMEDRLLPPPPSVTRLLTGNVDDEHLKDTIREASKFWLLDSLTYAYLSPAIKSSERQLLGTKLFTTNLGWANCWKPLKASLEKRMMDMGIQLEKEFWNDPSRDLVRKYR